MKHLFRIHISAAVLIVCFIPASCTSPGRAPSNVILITLDTMRADHLGLMTHADNAETPNLDALADDGMTFRHAFSPVPITLPAHAVIFYSQLPYDLGIYNNGQVFQPELKWNSLAEIFKDKGFHTAAFVSLGVLHSRFGLNRGFQDYVDTPHPRRWYLNAEEINQRVFSWLNDHAGDNFFIWIHYSDPHDPYAPPGNNPDLQFHINDMPLCRLSVRYKESLSVDIPLKPGRNILKIYGMNPFPSPRDEFRYSLNDFSLNPSESLDITVRKGALLSRNGGHILAIKNSAVVDIHNPDGLDACRLEAQGNINLFPSEMKQGYVREVEYMDQKIGELMARLRMLDLWDRTLLIAAGDHGEGLGDYLEHRQELYFGHIHYLKSVYTHIPLIIKAPDQGLSGKQVNDPVSLLDIAPALLYRMGWTSNKFFRGRNLFKLDKNRDTFMFQETYSPEAETDRFAGINFPWHLIFTPAASEFRLYRMDEADNPPADLYSQWRNDSSVTDLTRRVVERSLHILENKKEVQLDPSSLEMLKSLGYIK